MTELNYDINRSAYGGSNNRSYGNKSLRVLMRFRLNWRDSILLPRGRNDFATTIGFWISFITVFTWRRLCDGGVFLTATSGWITIIALFTFCGRSGWSFNAVTSNWINNFAFFASLKLLKNICRAWCGLITLAPTITKSGKRSAALLFLTISCQCYSIVIRVNDRDDDIFGWAFRQ